MKKPDNTERDVAFVGPSDACGHFPFTRHKSDGTHEHGIARVVKDGEPLAPDTELLQLNRREEGGYYVTDLGRVGPAKVATPAYRSGWDRVFGGKTEVGQA